MPGSLDHEEQDVKTFVSWVSIFQSQDKKADGNSVDKVLEHMVFLIL
jgi:hypothetical protein